MLKAIFSKRFLMHLLLGLMLAIMAIAGAYFFLVNYTRQEAVVEVPALQGFDLFEAESALKNLKLQGVVVDSLYLPEQRGGEIVDQTPPSGANVKEHRKIYLTIARYNAPMVRVPDILDQTLALALAKLESYDVKINDLISKPSDCTDCVIGIEMEGKSLKPGDAINKGASIDLVVGEGATGERIPVPVLFGLSLDEAQALLNMDGLNIGATPYLDCENAEDSANARVYRQTPDPDAGEKVPRGGSVDIYLTADMEKIPPVNLDSIKARLR
jgi:beta-lactam-binding protein with PASTA domain